MTQLDYLGDLNECQNQAVVSDAPSLQILAGPGSGKTRGKYEKKKSVFYHCLTPSVYFI
jgi:superfamily I DNA/RNA helicase